MTANLVAEYATSSGCPSFPATEAMLTIQPRRRARMAGSTARIP